VKALGIVAAEVVTNSYDHAFPGGGKGSIIVSVQSTFGDVDTFTMIISDDGKGFKTKAESKRHGLGLIRRLVEQVRGTATGWPHFVDNQRFISAAMRSRPASPSASLRRSPNGILRASAITSVARASQSWLWSDWAEIDLGGEPTMMLFLE
jgi:hypothetical protein